MSIIPGNLARVPTMLSSQVMLSSINRTSGQLLNSQTQLASGLRVNRPSDDPLASSAIGVIDDQLEQRTQRLRNLSHAESVLNNVDKALGDVTNLVQEARQIGLSQIGVGSDAQTRKNQARVIDAMLQELYNVGNREYLDIHLFGGNRTAKPPFSRLQDGVVFEGTTEPFVTDLGLDEPVALTLSGRDAFGAMSTRVQGNRDLNPGMTSETRLADLNGAVGSGVRRGTVQVDVNGTDFEIDLSDAETIDDVIQSIEDGFASQAPGALGPNGVRIDPSTGDRLSIDLNSGFTAQFGDPAGGFTAFDLGLSQQSFADGVNEVGQDVDPQLTDLTRIDQLDGVSSPLGVIRLGNGNLSRDVDLSGVTNVRELKNAVDSLDLGIRVEIAETGDRLNFVNELSGGRMSIGEVGGGQTATELGVRSLTTSTRLEDFNNGRGVEILSGYVDPVSGNPDPSRDLDFRVTLKDGRSFDVDLAGAETVEDVLSMINASASAAGILVPSEFEAGLVSDGNGISLTDNTPGTSTTVERLNGSFAAKDLGILGSTTGATLTGEDRARVAVDSVFSHLIELRDALESNDGSGIEFATAQLESDVERIAGSRAEVGVRTQRVVNLTQREEELRIQDTSIKSQLQDLDFTEAAIRLANLQTQLQASLATTSRIASLSLIDFL